MKTLKPQLNWEIKENPSHFQNPQGIWMPNSTKTLTRSDNGNVISVVNNTFGVMKNELLTEGVNRLQVISGFEVTGYDDGFHGGAKVLAYLKNPDTSLEINGSKIKSYMVLGSANDGSKSTFIGTTDIVISCMNQFSQILQMNVIKHTKSHNQRFENLITEYQHYILNRKLMIEKLEKFADIKMDKDVQKKLVEHMLRFEGENLASTRKQNTINRVLENVEIETGIHGNNGWGVFNGITRYTTHEIKPKHEVFGNYFGTQNKLNQQVFTSLEQMIN